MANEADFAPASNFDGRHISKNISYLT